MRRCRRTGMLALSVSEVDAAEQEGVSLRSLFHNDAWAWKLVSDALDRRRTNRASVALSYDRTGRVGDEEERTAASAARATLLTAANRPILDSIAADAALLATRIRAENALLTALDGTAEADPINNDGLLAA